jgi:hypothetical protein
MATLDALIPITVSESLARREAVSNAITDLRLEGLKPSAAVLDLLCQYSGGEIGETELMDRVLNR